MRRWWGVWIAYDLPGSYEELPPNLLDELKRDHFFHLAALGHTGHKHGHARCVGNPPQPAGG